jgi:hypothetical protein
MPSCVLTRNANPGKEVNRANNHAGKSIPLATLLQFQSQLSTVSFELSRRVLSVLHTAFARSLGFVIVASLAEARQGLAEIATRQSGVFSRVGFGTCIACELRLLIFEQFIEQVA